jgi:hypothetical protein
VNPYPPSPGEGPRPPAVPVPRAGEPAGPPVVRSQPGRGRHGASIAAGAALAVAALVAGTAVAVLGTRRGDEGPDPFQGAYPIVPATPSATSTVRWTPGGRPAGPLRRFPGRPSRVAGTVVDRRAGLSYARLGPPWSPIKGVGSHSAGVEYVLSKPSFQWYGSVGSSPLLEKFTPVVLATAGPYRLRAAAELSARLRVSNQAPSGLTPIAGQPLRVGGHRAWLTGYRVRFGSPFNGITERTYVIVAVDTGRRLPAIFDASLAKPKYAMLPDINTAVKSLRVVR